MRTKSRKMMMGKKMMGKGWHGDSARHARAGRKGGMATAKSHGERFYSRIGRKGGQSQGRRNNPGNFANDRAKARRAGKKGGSR